MEIKTLTTEYYVGDLCYVMHDAWSEVCDLTPFDNSAHQFNLSDGRTFFLLNTKYGDGTYRDQLDRMYSVDSGTLGAIKVRDIRDPEATPAMMRRLGQIVSMPELQEHDCYADEGTLVFGTVVIETGDVEEDEDWDFAEEEDEETDFN